VVIVDDYSTDMSPDLIRAAIREEPRARLIRHERNCGVAAARNTIINNARGVFVAFFDDDDESIPDRLRAQWERITAYERDTGAPLVFCYSDRTIVEIGMTHPTSLSLGMGRRKSREPHGQAVADFLLSVDRDPRFDWGQFGSCTLMARLDSFRAAGGFDPSFRRCAEIDLAVRGAFMGAHFISVDRPLITQYKTPSSDKVNTAPLQYALLLRTKHQTYLKPRRLYLASIARAYSDFYNSRGAACRSLAYRLLALLLSLQRLASIIRRRFFTPAVHVHYQ
jgi:glycosyltransferase involved in cell wall biosynthesis